MYQAWSEWIGQAGHLADSSAYEPLRQQVLEKANPRSGETVIDVGAGLGLLTFALAERVQPDGRVIAVEPSDDCRVKLLQERQQRKIEHVVEVRQGAAEALGLDGELADLIVTRSVLIYVSDKAQAFREFARVLKPGGRMVCWEPINGYFYRTGRLHHWFDLSSLGDVERTVAEAERSYFAQDDPMCNFTENDLLYAAESAGFSSLAMSVEHSIMHQELTLEQLKGMLGWDSHLAPTYPTFREWLAERLSHNQMTALVNLIDRQLTKKKVRTEGARALLVGTK